VDKGKLVHVKKRSERVKVVIILEYSATFLRKLLTYKGINMKRIGRGEKDFSHQR